MDSAMVSMRCKPGLEQDSCYPQDGFYETLSLPEQKIYESLEVYFQQCSSTGSFKYTHASPH